MASASTLPSLYQGVEKGSFGYKMLATMGWKEGQGLGANKQGIIEHVKVKKKQDALGVGAAEHVHKLRDWTTGMVGFDAILTGLKEISRAPHSSSSSSDYGSSSSSEGHESGYASDSDTSVEVEKNSSKIAAAAAAVVGFKGGDISKDQPLNKNQKKRKLGASVASNNFSKKMAKELNSNKKRKKAGETPAAGKSSKTSIQTASAAAAAAVGNASETGSSESDSDADSDSPTQPAAAAAVRPNISRGKAATHLGRYQKREKAKTVRNYSATDLAAILGLPGSAPGAPTAEGAAGWTAAAGISNPNSAAAASSSSSDDSSSSDGSESDHDSSDQRLRPTTPPGSDTPPVRNSVSQQQQQRQVLGSGSSDQPRPVAAAAEDAGTGSSGSWWRSVFVRADRGAGSVIWSIGKKRINVSGFLEEDQTNLYMQAHEAAVKNKQGLGRSAMPKKVAGARWQGKKTKLGSDSEDEQPQQQQQVKKQQQQQQEEEEAAVAGAGCKSYTKNGITIVMPIRRSEEQRQQQVGGVQQQQQQQQIGGFQQQQQQQQRDRKQKRKQERDGSGSGVKVKLKADQQQAAAESDKPVAAAAALATPSSRKKQKYSDQQRQVQQAAVEPSPSTAAAAAGSRKVKWAKLAAKILEGAPKKRMRVQKLHKAVVAAAGYDVDAPGVDSEKLYQQMLGKLRKAEGLEVCDKYVAMA